MYTFFYMDNYLLYWWPPGLGGFSHANKQERKVVQQSTPFMWLQYLFSKTSTFLERQMLDSWISITFFLIIFNELIQINVLMYFWLVHTNNKQTHDTCSIRRSSPQGFMSNFELLTMIETGKVIIT